MPFLLLNFLLCYEHLLPRRSVGFDVFLRTAARAVPTVWLSICSGRCPHRPNAICNLIRRGRRSLRKINCITWFIFGNKPSNPQALCASSFAKGAYAVSHGFADSLFFRLSYRLGLLRKGAARRAED